MQSPLEGTCKWGKSRDDLKATLSMTVFGHAGIRGIQVQTAVSAGKRGKYHGSGIDVHVF